MNYAIFLACTILSMMPPTFRIEDLRYKNVGKAVKYTLNFNWDMPCTSWNNKALYQQFYKGLSERLKNKLTRISKPDMLIPLQHQVQATHFINKLDLSPYCNHPIKLRLLNGSLGSWITYVMDLRICHSTGDIFSLVTQLDPPIALVFGYIWFYHYNPLIDWYKSQILSFQTLLQVSNLTLIGTWLPELQPTHSVSIQPESMPTGLLLSEPQPESPPSSSVTPEVKQPKSSVSFIITAAYICAAWGSVSFQFSLSDLSLHRQSASTAPAEPDMSDLLKE